MSEASPSRYTPADRASQQTEHRLAASASLDVMDTQQILTLINAQDATIPAIVAKAIPMLTQLVDAIVASFEQGGRLIYLGAGTSGRLGVLDASECPPTFQSDPEQVVGIIAGGDTALRRSSEGKEDDPAGAHEALAQLNVGAQDVVVGIAAGGTTPYVLGALQEAKRRQAATALICCARVTVQVDHYIELAVGPEVVTGSTRMKAGTATKLALNMISTAAMVRMGKTYGNLMVDLRATNDKLIDRALRIICSQTDLDREQARTLLEQANRKVKTALVMHHQQVDVQQAEQLLEQSRQRLRAIIGPPASDVGSEQNHRDAEAQRARH